MVLTRSEIAELLSKTMGSEKANVVVDEAADAMAFPREMEASQALALLERIACEPGVVGIAARFAKSRALLRWKL